MKEAEDFLQLNLFSFSQLSLLHLASLPKGLESNCPSSLCHDWGQGSEVITSTRPPHTLPHLTLAVSSGVMLDHH
uniref:Uncharacterized protein n=1 Tax=Anguilla anguilla TaxID=7936 RepID=A0A0E9X6Y1_ANGAN